jgi:hypothetical protein
MGTVGIDGPNFYIISGTTVAVISNLQSNHLSVECPVIFSRRGTIRQIQQISSMKKAIKNTRSLAAVIGLILLMAGTVFARTDVVPDTLFYGDTPSILENPFGSGFIAGKNGYNDTGKYQRFDIAANVNVIGTGLYFGVLQDISDSDSLTVVVRGVGANGAPGVLLYSMAVAAKSLQQGLDGNYFRFSEPLTVAGADTPASVFIGVEWGPTFSGVFALYCDADGQGDEAGRAWERFDDGGFNDFGRQLNPTFSWGIDVDLFISALHVPLAPISGPLSGNYTIPSATGFPSLAAAFNTLNEFGADGMVTFLVADDLDERNNVLTINRPDITQSTRVTIRPAPGTKPTITLSGRNTAATESAGAGIAIFNTSWVTINGAAEGNSRDLTVLYDDAGAGANGIISIIGESYVVSVVNSNIQYTEALPTVAGIRVRRDNAATVVPVGLVFDNNAIGSLDKPVREGVALFGVGSPMLRVEARVTNNDIFATWRAITTFFVEDNVYEGNRITVTGTSANPAWYAGVYLAGGSGMTSISNNEMILTGANFTADGRYSAGVVINLNLGEITIANNMISHPEDFTVHGSSSAFNRYGIVFHREGGGETYNIIHNSVYLNQGSAINGISAAIGFEANGTLYSGRNHNSSMAVVNNIFVNNGKSANDFAIQWPHDSGAPDANHNNYYVDPASDARVGFYNQAATATLAAWKSASNVDASSTDASVEFMSSSDLRLTGESLGDQNLAGVFMPAFATDIFGTSRNTQNPYKGAFESEVTITSLEHVNTLPASFNLYQNYPNPFNPSTTIRFELPVEAMVRLQIYTVNGQLVTTLVNDIRAAGEHLVTFDAAQLASGVYVYRLVAGDFVQTRTMSLIK